jgi:hypothetical protein
MLTANKNLLNVQKRTVNTGLTTYSTSSSNNAVDVSGLLDVSIDLQVPQGSNMQSGELISEFSGFGFSPAVDIEYSTPGNQDNSNPGDVATNIEAPVEEIPASQEQFYVDLNIFGLPELKPRSIEVDIYEKHQTKRLFYISHFESYIDDFYSLKNPLKKDNIDMLHSISSNIPLTYPLFTDIKAFKRDVIENYYDNINSDILRYVEKIPNFISFFDSKTKNNFKVINNSVNNIETELESIKDFVSEKDFMVFIKDYSKNNNRFNKIGKILTRAYPISISNEDDFNIIPNREITKEAGIDHKISDYLDDESSFEFLQRYFGSYLDEEPSNLNVGEFMCTDTFIVQQITNLSFSMYSLYPTVIKEKSYISYQDLNNRKKAFYTNFYDVHTLKKENMFSNISIGNKTTNNQNLVTLNPKIQMLRDPIPSFENDFSEFFRENSSYSGKRKILYNKFIESIFNFDPGLDDGIFKQEITRFINKVLVQDIAFSNDFIEKLQSVIIGSNLLSIYKSYYRNIYSNSNNNSINGFGRVAYSDNNVYQRLTFKDIFYPLIPSSSSDKTIDVFLKSESFTLFDQIKNETFDILRFFESENIQNEVIYYQRMNKLPQSFNYDLFLLDTEYPGISRESLIAGQIIARFFINGYEFLEIDELQRAEYVELKDGNENTAFSNSNSGLFTSVYSKKNIINIRFVEVRGLEGKHIVVSKICLPNTLEQITALHSELIDVIEKRTLVKVFFRESLILVEDREKNQIFGNNSTRLINVARVLKLMIEHVVNLLAFGLIKDSSPNSSFFENLFLYIEKISKDNLADNSIVVNEIRNISNFLNDRNRGAFINNTTDSILELLYDTEEGIKIIENDIENDMLNVTEKYDSSLYNEILKTDNVKIALSNISNINIEENIIQTGYLYYKNNLDDELKLSEENTNISVSDEYFKTNKLSFEVDELVKKSKLNFLEKNNIDYSIFRNHASDLSNLYSSTTISFPTFASEANITFSPVNEDSDIFKLLITKSNDKFYSNFNFSQSLDYADLKIESTINKFVDNIEENDFTNSFKENYNKLLSNYFYKSSVFNNSSLLLNTVYEDIKRNIESGSSNIKDLALQYLYLCNFEEDVEGINVNGKNSIITRFIRRAISNRKESSDILKFSNLGYEFDMSSVDSEKFSTLNEDEKIEYYKDLFSSNEDYKLLRNTIFSKNKNFKKFSEFFYIPINSISIAKSKTVNGVSSKDEVDLNGPIKKFGSDGTGTGDLRGTRDDFIAKFNVHTSTFPFCTFIKKNVPLSIGYLINSGGNVKKLVNNDIEFNNNINSKKAESEILYVIKNVESENYIVNRLKISDNFDNLCINENSIFNKIVRRINTILSLNTNINELTFQDLEDIDSFVTSNKFVLDMSSKIIKLYAIIFNKIFRETQEKAFIKNINTYNNIGLGIENSEGGKVFKIESSGTTILNDSTNFKNYSSLETKIKSNIIDETYRGISGSIQYNYDVLKISDFMQSLSFDILNKYIEDSIEINSKENVDILVNRKLEDSLNEINLDRHKVKDMMNTYYMNCLSKELSKKYYIKKDFFTNFIENQDSINIQDTKEYYLNGDKNLLDSIKKYNININEFNAGTDELNKKILTFGIKFDLMNHIHYSDIINIKIQQKNKYNNIEEYNYCFSPLITSLISAFNDSRIDANNSKNINIGLHTGFYDIFKNINERYMIVGKDYLKTHLLKNIYRDSDSDSDVIEKIITSHFRSNKYDAILNCLYNFNIEQSDFYKDKSNNIKSIDKDFYDKVNSLNDFKFSSITKTSKEKFNNNININDNIVIFNNDINPLNNETYIYKSLSSLNNINSINDIKLCFENKEFYDFYHIPINNLNDIVNINVEFSIQ